MLALCLTYVFYAFYAKRIIVHSKSRRHSSMVRPWSFIIAFLFPIVMFVLHGCASVPDNYPAQWPERLYTSGQACPDITGIYSNPGDGSVKEYLFDSITNEGLFGTHECADCKVMLGWVDPDQTQLSVKLHDATGSTLEGALLKKTEGDFSCMEGAISIKYLVGVELVVAGVIRSGTRKYYQSEDGSLILEDDFTAAGHMYVYIPVGNKSTAYTRWLRADAVGQKMAADYEARTMMLARHLHDKAKPAAKEYLTPEPLPANTADAWWEVFKSSSSHGEPDFQALCKAADQGDSRARRELGYLHYHGLHGVRKDMVLSSMWYGLIESYSQGPNSFSTGREQLTPEQITELKDLYINWKPGHCERELFGNESSNSN